MKNKLSTTLDSLAKDQNHRLFERLIYLLLALHDFNYVFGTFNANGDCVLAYFKSLTRLGFRFGLRSQCTSWPSIALLKPLIEC